MRHTALIAAVVLSGCASVNPVAYAPVSQLTDDQLCAAYSVKDRRIAAFTEMEKRGLAIDLVTANERLIGVGMSRCQVLAAWGSPSKVNRASYGDQWVYCRDGAYCINNQYVYLRNGRVTGWN